MNPQVNITYAEAISSIRKMLAVYAKRAKDKQGNMLFQDFTISTAEEAACKVYVQFAVNSVISDILQFVQGVTTTPAGISFRAENKRWESYSDRDFSAALAEHIHTFSALYAISKIFQSVTPALVKAIEEDAMGAKRDIHDMFFFKYPSKPSTKEPEDITAIVAPT